MRAEISELVFPEDPQERRYIAFLQRGGTSAITRVIALMGLLFALEVGRLSPAIVSHPNSAVAIITFVFGVVFLLVFAIAGKYWRIPELLAKYNASSTSASHPSANPLDSSTRSRTQSQLAPSEASSAGKKTRRIKKNGASGTEATFFDSASFERAASAIESDDEDNTFAVSTDDSVSSQGDVKRRQISPKICERWLVCGIIGFTFWAWFGEAASASCPWFDAEIFDATSMPIASAASIVTEHVLAWLNSASQSASAIALNRSFTAGTNLTIYRNMEGILAQSVRNRVCHSNVGGTESMMFAVFLFPVMLFPLRSAVAISVIVLQFLGFVTVAIIAHVRIGLWLDQSFLQLSLVALGLEAPSSTSMLPSSLWASAPAQHHRTLGAKILLFAASAFFSIVLNLKRNTMYRKEFSRKCDLEVTQKRTKELIDTLSKQVTATLPAHVVRRIVRKEFVCDLVPHAGILAFGVLQFSSWSSHHSSSEVVQILNQLFCAVDEQLSRHPSISKMQTLGDLYVAVAGLNAASSSATSDSASESHVRSGSEMEHVEQNSVSYAPSWFATLNAVRDVFLFAAGAKRSCDEQRLAVPCKFLLHCGPVAAALFGSTAAYVAVGDGITEAIRALRTTTAVTASVTGAHGAAPSSNRQSTAAGGGGGFGRLGNELSNNANSRFRNNAIVALTSSFQERLNETMAISNASSPTGEHVKQSIGAAKKSNGNNSSSKREGVAHVLRVDRPTAPVRPLPQAEQAPSDSDKRETTSNNFFLNADDVIRLQTTLKQQGFRTRSTSHVDAQLQLTVDELAAAAQNPIVARSSGTRVALIGTPLDPSVLEERFDAYLIRVEDLARCRAGMALEATVHAAFLVVMLVATNVDVSANSERGRTVAGLVLLSFAAAGTCFVYVALLMSSPDSFAEGTSAGPATGSPTEVRRPLGRTKSLLPRFVVESGHVLDDGSESAVVPWWIVVDRFWNRIAYVCFVSAVFVLPSHGWLANSGLVVWAAAFYCRSVLRFTRGSMNGCAWQEYALIALPCAAAKLIGDSLRIDGDTIRDVVSASFLTTLSPNTFSMHRAILSQCLQQGWVLLVFIPAIFLLLRIAQHDMYRNFFALEIDVEQEAERLRAVQDSIQRQIRSVIPRHMQERFEHFTRLHGNSIFNETAVDPWQGTWFATKVQETPILVVKFQTFHRPPFAPEPEAGSSSNNNNNNNTNNNLSSRSSDTSAISQKQRRTLPSSGPLDVVPVVANHSVSNSYFDVMQLRAAHDKLEAVLGLMVKSVGKAKSAGDTVILIGAETDDEAIRGKNLMECASSILRCFEGEPFGPKLVLNSGLGVGAVIGSDRLTFELFGEVVSTAMELLNAMPTRGIVATQRFVRLYQQLTSTSQTAIRKSAGPPPLTVGGALPVAPAESVAKAVEFPDLLLNSAAAASPLQRIEPSTSDALVRFEDLDDMRNGANLASLSDASCMRHPVMEEKSSVDVVAHHHHTVIRARNARSQQQREQRADDEFEFGAKGDDDEVGDEADPATVGEPMMKVDTAQTTAVRRWAPVCLDFHAMRPAVGHGPETRCGPVGSDDSVNPQTRVENDTVELRNMCYISVPVSEDELRRERHPLAHEIRIGELQHWRVRGCGNVAVHVMHPATDYDFTSHC